MAQIVDMLERSGVGTGRGGLVLDAALALLFSVGMPVFESLLCHLSGILVVPGRGGTPRAVHPQQLAFP